MKNIQRIGDLTQAIDFVRLVIFTHCPPLPSWGGAMTFYRHFIERSEFETMVFTSSGHLDHQSLPYTPRRVSLPRWWERLTRTRLSKWFQGFQLLQGQCFLKRVDVAEARLFRPDAVFTVAGSWDWTALAAQKLARQLEVPLIASFNDWFDYGSYPMKERFRVMIERRFRKFYREADLALCTSEGMRNALGEHRNAHVWYPTGAPVPEDPDQYTPQIGSEQRPMTVFFGGSLGDWYGPMLETLVIYCREHVPCVRFKIYGALETWSDEFDQWVRAEGIFGGRLDFEELLKRAAKADLLILPMGFGEECALVERTSFKTKFLDYLSFQRPILVWGPEYCSAVRVAREFDSGECVTERSAAVCAQVIARLADDPGRRRKLIENASKMYQDRFHPDRIHSGLVKKVRELISKRA